VLISIVGVFACLMVLAVGIVACGSSSGPLAVDSVSLMRDDGSGKPGDTVTDFKPTDHKIFAEAKLNQAATGVPAKATWVAVDTSAGKNITIASVDLGTLEGANTLDTNISMPRDLPTGSYRVDFYLNGSVAKSATFQVNQ
ncbi:MAG TPA: hypothetical protein VFZ25_00830, partial [Chloroflexota bacterium]|nr:hypothetical protein [Chloroflexota bacterium]